MADAVDMAAQIEAEHLARGLASVSAAIPEGVAGECDECGEQMPRLVGGRCGFCRDGRRPPLSRFDDQASPAPARVPLAAPRGNERNPPRPSPSEPATMTAKPPSRAITFTATGDVLAAIEQLAAANGCGLGRAGLMLVEERLEQPDAAEAQPTAPAEPDTRTPRQRMVGLLDEVATLFMEQFDIAQRAAAHPDQSEALAAATARAEAAEAKVTAMQAVLS